MSDNLSKILEHAAAIQLAVAPALAAREAPRMVTEDAELDALPPGTVVLDRDGDAWQKSTDPDPEGLFLPWMLTGGGAGPQYPAPYFRPLRVLYVPGED